MPTIGALIAGWYNWCGGVATVGCTIDDAAHAFIPSGTCSTQPSSPETCGWSSAIPGYTAAQLKDAYQVGPRVYCRSYHANMVAGFNVQNFFAFANSGVKAPIFQQGYHIMPDAEILYNQFWAGYPNANPGGTALSKLYP
jgi:hypothetical protein